MKFKGSNRTHQVGKDNVIYAEIHYDEDTPHLHFYFMPIVSVVKRKVFETDSNGNIVYREGIDKKGNKKMYPVQKKDVLINKLTDKVETLQSENTKLKDSRAIKERDTKIYEQQQTISKQKNIIKEKNSIIEKLEEKVNEIQETFNNFKKNF